MFEWQRKYEIEYLVDPTWASIGIQHGFIGSSANFRDAVFEQAAAGFSAAFSVQRLIVLNQTHSSDLVTLPQGGECGDGIVLTPQKSEQRIAYGIRTADCLALSMYSNNTFALVHAGWRGLAAGIVERAAKAIAKKSLDVLCWPSAGFNDYQVGPEVVDAIGPTAVFEERAHGIFLDLAATAKTKLEQLKIELRFVESGLSTISDTRFHSFRRDQENRGSNLAFLIR